MFRPPMLDALEPRRFASMSQALVTADPTFGQGGVASIALPRPADDTRVVLTPVVDGRLIAIEGAHARFLHGDGAADAKRGTRGALSLADAAGAAPVAAAADPLTGRIATLHYIDDAASVGLTLTSFDARGRRVASRVFQTAGYNADGTGTATLAFDRAGRIVVSWTYADVASTDAAGETTARRILAYVQANDPVTLEYQPLGVSVGVAAFIVVENAIVAEADAAAVSGLFFDAAGRTYVETSVWDRAADGATGLRTEQFTRLAASGTRDRTYNDTGTAAVFSSSLPGANSSPDVEVVDLLDATVDLNGRATVLGYARPNRATNRGGFLLYQAAGDRKFFTRRWIDPFQIGDAAAADRASGALAADADGTLHVAAVANDTTAQLVRIDARDDLSGEIADHLTSTSTSVAIAADDLAVDAAGRLLLSEARDDEVRTLAFAGDGTATLAAGVGGSAALLPDGTLLVTGTSRADAIEIRTRRGRTYVTVNRRATSFRSGDVGGIVVRAGRGDDRVTFGSAIAHAYVDGAGGDDDLDVSALADARSSVTLFGGSGNDTLRGGAGFDYLYGQAGTDVFDGSYLSDLNDGPEPYTIPYVAPAGLTSRRAATSFVESDRDDGDVAARLPLPLL